MEPSNSSIPQPGSAASTLNHETRQAVRSQSLTGFPSTENVNLRTTQDAPIKSKWFKPVKDESLETEVTVNISPGEVKWRRLYYLCLAILLVNGWIGLAGGFIEVNSVQTTGISLFYISMAGLLMGGLFSDFGVIAAHVGMYGNRIPFLVLFWIAQGLAMLFHIGFTSVMTYFYLQMMANPYVVGKNYWDKAMPTALVNFEKSHGCTGWDACQNQYVAAVLQDFQVSMALGWTQACVMGVIGPFLWWVVKNLTRVATAAIQEEELEQQQRGESGQVV